MNKELNEDVPEQIVELCKAVDSFANHGDFDSARRRSRSSQAPGTPHLWAHERQWPDVENAASHAPRNG
jgi:hypothetical protein